MFASDNNAGASPAVMAKLLEANDGATPAYGADEWTARAKAMLAEWFETDVEVYFLSTGSAANGLAIAACHRPSGKAVCHVDAHIIRDEYGGPALFAPGLMMVGLDGPAGKIAPDALELALEEHRSERHGRLSILSLTNVNEIGQTYSPAEVARLAEIAKADGITVHVDGARFANALVETGASPAALTWQAGVDMLSLGFTKTGAWSAEALVIFNQERVGETYFHHRVMAQQLSKNRVFAAQFIAMLEDNHAVTLAAQANASATELGAVLEASDRASLLHPVASNEVFAYLAPGTNEALKAAGVMAYPWVSLSRQKPAPPQPGWVLHRFVASFQTTPQHIKAVESALTSKTE